jgi:hypothetical protein
MAETKPIPQKIANEILLRNQAACCICGESNVQIHHIDGNRTNHSFQNLAVLCIGHHNQASSKSSMTRQLKPSFIRQCKASWEEQVMRRRQLVRRNFIKKQNDQPFIRFEIKRLIYSLPAFPDKKTTNSIIEQLYHWHLFTMFTKNILEDISYIRWFLKDLQVAIVLDRLWEFFWQFVGPEDVPMNKTDEKDLLNAIDLIGDLGQQMILVNRNPHIFKNLFSAMKHFKDIAYWYKNPKLKRRIKSNFIEIRKELLDTRRYPQRKDLLGKIDKEIKKLS